jgi:hypothetical protein
MHRSSLRPAALALLAGLGLGLGVLPTVLPTVLTGPRAAAAASGTTAAAPVLRADAVFSAVELVDVEGEVLRLDTRTGLMHALSGDTSFTGTATRWRVRVQPVAEKTSGFLSLHRRLIDARTVYVLVDEVTGETWILRYRERDRGTWSRISVQVP